MRDLGGKEWKKVWYISIAETEKARRRQPSGWQSGQRVRRDITNEQVDIADVALHGQTLYLLGITRVQHHATQSLQRTASDTNTANMPDVVTVTLYKTGSCTH